MRAIEFLKESSGGMMRRAEESNRGKVVSFRNPQGDNINLLDAFVIPEEGDQVEDQPELDQGLRQYLGSKSIALNDAKFLPPQFGLTTPEKAGAALVLVFYDEQLKKNIAYIALKQKKKPGAYPIFLSNTEFTSLTGYVLMDGKVPGSGKMSSTQERAQMKLKPIDVIPTNVEIPTDSIPAQAQQFISRRTDLDEEVKHQIVELLENVLEGKAQGVPGADQFLKAYEIDLGETAAPMALVKNNFVTGAYTEAEAGVLAPLGASFATIRSVKFPSSGTENLYDSYLVIDDRNILRVSSKDKSGGAKASVIGILKDIQKYPERFEGLFQDPEMNKILETIKTINDPDKETYVGKSPRWKRNGSIAGALQLGVQLAVITKDQSDRIMTIIDSDTKTLTERQLGDLAKLLDYKGTRDTTRPDYRIGWHLLAAVATEVCNRINSNPKVDAFFKAVLERSNMIQVKTRMSKDANGAYFSQFEVIYPPVFTGKMTMDSSTNFYATREPVGKLGFGF
jgi:hypothetical protein